MDIKSLIKTLSEIELYEARMGDKDLANLKLPENFTIGFEFEVAGEEDDFKITEDDLVDYGYDID